MGGLNIQKELGNNLMEVVLGSGILSEKNISDFINTIKQELIKELLKDGNAAIITDIKGEPYILLVKKANVQIENGITQTKSVHDFLSETANKILKILSNGD